MKNKSIYEKCKVWWWGGYYVRVRNSINYHLEKRHLSDAEKELFEKKFGETILMDTEFNDWYLKEKIETA